MKKKLFDVRLYCEGLRQLRLFGALFAFLLALAAILVPVGEVIAQGSFTYQFTVGLWEMFPFTAFNYCICAPIMTLVLFRFLTDRGASDFYHAIPQTRTCLLLSFTAAVLTWSLAIQWGTTLLSLIMHVCFPASFVVNIIGVLRCSVQVSAAVVFVVAAVVLAVSLTGTILTNIVVSLIIIFLPRGLMLFIRESLTSVLGLVSSRFLSFFGNGYNVVTGSIFGGGDLEDLTLRFGAGAYTLLIAILYLVLACVVFYHRKSEAAGDAAIHPKLRLVIRVIVGTVICLIPDFLIFWNIADHDEVEAGMIFAYFVLYLVGVIVYFLYELISTRKWRNMVRAIPGLVLLVVVNVVIVFGMLGVEQAVLAFTPTADRISYVSLSGGGMTVENDYLGSGVDYLASGVAEVKISDEEIKELVATRLSEQAKVYKSEGNFSNILTKYGEGSYMDVTICVNGLKKYREIYFSTADLEEITQYFETDETVRDLYMNLPAADGAKVSISYEDFSEQDAKAVYEGLLADIADMGFTDWYIYANGGSEFDSYYGKLTLTVTDGGKEKVSEFDITDVTPKAASAYLAVKWENQEAEREGLLQNLKHLEEIVSGGEMIEVVDGSCELFAWLADGEEAYLPLDLNDADQLAYLVDLVEETKDIPVTSCENYVSLSMWLSYEYASDTEDSPSVSASVSVMGEEVWSTSTFEGIDFDGYLALPDGFDASEWEEGNTAIFD